MIKVLIADDQTLVRQGIRSLLALSDAIEVVAEAADGAQVFPALAAHPVEVILLDLQMPNMTGLQVLQRMGEDAIDIPVIVLTTFDDDAQLLACAKLGARGYLLKDVSLDQLVSAVRKVVAGELLIQPAVTERVIRGLEKRSLEFESTECPEALSPRELEVLRYMSGGYSNREIAESLHLSEGTVKNYVSCILAKFGVRDRTRAVIKGVDLGLLD